MPVRWGGREGMKGFRYLGCFRDGGGSRSSYGEILLPFFSIHKD